MDMQTYAASDRSIPETPFGPGVSHSMEHRWGQRIRCQAFVRLSAGSGVGGRGRVRNVSASGAYVETSVELPTFGIVSVSVMHEDAGPQEEEVLAVVVRQDREGVGIEWCETPLVPVCRLLGCTLRCAHAAPEDTA